MQHGMGVLGSGMPRGLGPLTTCTCLGDSCKPGSCSCSGLAKGPQGVCLPRCVSSRWILEETGLGQA